MNTPTNPKLYRCIAKVSNEGFIKHSTNDLLKYVDFLDRKYQDWRYFNVYQYQKDGKGIQLTSFTKFNRPYKKTL